MGKVQFEFIIWIEAAVLLMILINAPPEAKESN
jgi:hypothetical protein